MTIFLERVEWFKNKKPGAIFLSPKRNTPPPTKKNDELAPENTEKVSKPEKSELERSTLPEKTEKHTLKSLKLPLDSLDSDDFTLEGANITPPLTPHIGDAEKESHISPNWDAPRLAREFRRERERNKRNLAEAERKISVLTSALEDKANQAVDLARQARKDERTIKELASNLSVVESEKEQVRTEHEKLVLENIELKRRINTVTASLEMLATENLELKSQVPLNERENIRAVFSLTQPAFQDQSTVHILTGKIEEMERKLAHLQRDLLKEQQKELSYQESVRKYEKKNNKTQFKKTERI